VGAARDEVERDLSGIRNERIDNERFVHAAVAPG
jgi:hypothetical protein